MKDSSPLITISIPTYNSEIFLDLCLDAIKKQTYKNIEINIIDGYSKDNTLQITKKYHIAKVYQHRGSLMSARYIGVQMAKGQYTLLLDSDQILERNSIARCIAEINKKKVDMLVLGEDVYYNKTFLEKLFHMDRKFIHHINDIDPYTSVLLPRFYKTSLLRKAYANVPKKVIQQAMPQDHAILYLESWKLSDKVAIVQDAVKHIEPSSLISLWKKFFRWGYHSVGAYPTKYDIYFKKRTERFRKGNFKKELLKESLASTLLLLLKGIPYRIGYYCAVFNKKIGKKT